MSASAHLFGHDLLDETIRKHNLPAEVASFVGREHELADQTYTASAYRKLMLSYSGTQMMNVAESLVRRHGEAWQAMDIGQLVGLLKQDVILTMPPVLLRFTGRAAVIEFFKTLPLAGRGRFQVVLTRANRQPALAVNRRDGAGDAYRAWGIWVLTLDGDAIAEVAAFVDRFGLPTELEHGSASPG